MKHAFLIFIFFILLSNTSCASTSYEDSLLKKYSKNIQKTDKEYILTAKNGKKIIYKLTEKKCDEICVKGEKCQTTCDTSSAISLEDVFADRYVIFKDELEDGRYYPVIDLNSGNGSPIIGYPHFSPNLKSVVGVENGDIYSSIELCEIRDDGFTRVFSKYDSTSQDFAPRFDSWKNNDEVIIKDSQSLMVLAYNPVLKVWEYRKSD